ncbi:MAG TPA: hypothetical protein V6C95_03380 [Coleofasciculaceae cyanobacterium]
MPSLRIGFTALITFLYTLLTPHFLVSATINSSEASTSFSTSGHSVGETGSVYPIAQQPTGNGESASPLQFPEFPSLSSCLKLSSSPTGPYVNFPLSSKDAMLSEIAIQYASIAQYEQSLEIAKMIQDDYRKAHTFVTIAGVYINAGQREQATQTLSQALQVVQRIKDDNQAGLIAQIAVKLAEAGQVTQSLQLARNQDYMRDYTLGEIAAQLAEAGQITQALEVAQTIDEFNIAQTRAFAAIANHYIQAAQYNQAVQLAQSIEDACTQAHTSNEIVAQLSKVKQYHLALQVAQFIEDAAIKAETLMKLAGYHMADGQINKALLLLSEALQLAQGISYNKSKAEVLIQIAAKLAEAGQVNQASDILSQVLKIAEASENYRSPPLFPLQPMPLPREPILPPAIAPD